MYFFLSDSNVLRRAFLRAPGKNTASKIQKAEKQNLFSLFSFFFTFFRSVAYMKKKMMMKDVNEEQKYGIPALLIHLIINNTQQQRNRE